MTGAGIPLWRGGRPKREFANAPVACAIGQADGCGTWCCRRTLVILAREDVDEGIEREPGFVDLLRRRDDMTCWNLGDDGRCAVWEKRPLDCRVFSCEGRSPPQPLGSGPAGVEALWAGGDRRADRLPCVRCGSAEGYVARFLGETGRMRCAACGGAFAPIFFEGRPFVLHPDPTPLTEATRHAMRAETREYVGDLESAVAAYREAALLEPGVVDHWLGLGRAASAAGDEATAEAAFVEAERLAPARAWLGRGLARESDEAFRRGAELGSTSPWTAWGLARAAERRGDAAEAVRRLEQAAVASGNDPRVMQALIDLGLAGGDGGGAARAAIERLGDRRAGAAIGVRRPWLQPEDAAPPEDVAPPE